MKSLLLFPVVLCSAFPAFCQSPKAKELVSKMSLEEKTSLVVGMGMKMPGAADGGPVVGQTMDKVEGAAGTTYAVPRLGLPNTVVADGPAGLRINPIRKNDGKTYYATAWPVATLLASTWDTALVKRVGEAMGNEVKEYGVDLILGPGMNIHRNPLGGRNFEYYSEDPLVSGKTAAAMVNGIQSNGVGTSIKHFAANNQETNRNTVNTIVSERALREIYLKGFAIAVKEARPWTVMSSYNYINGKYASEDYDLLTTILRKEWGFKGMVMSDWFGGKDPVGQMKAGNDLLMPGTPEQRKAIQDAVTAGTLDMKVLDENAGRIVDYILKTSSFRNYAFSNKPDLKAHAAIAREAAADGMVLLKNDKVALPLSKTIKRVAAFGTTSYDFVSGGTGSGDVNEEYTVSLVQGLESKNLVVDEELKALYSPYIVAEKSKQPKKTFLQEFSDPTPRIPELAMDKNLLQKKAAETDLAIITIGRNAGEGSDRKVGDNFTFSAAEKTLIGDVAAAFHASGKKVILILNTGGVVEVESWQRDVDAVLLAWQPGLEGGNAVADLLTGAVNPSGKLATTFPVKYEDVPSAKNFPGKEFPERATTNRMGMKLVPGEVTYEEGIYVGYRYYNTFNVKPAYEFGYGLSYTSFGYGTLQVSSTSFEKRLTLSITVTNTGKVAGKEVVQLYLQAPRGKLDKPSEELKGFAKTGLLQPGASQKLFFTITPNDLASFDTEAGAWIADAGSYVVKIGSSSRAIKQTGGFTLAKSIVAEKCNKAMPPQGPIAEMKRK